MRRSSWGRILTRCSRRCICDLRLVSLAKTRLLPNRKMCSFQYNQPPAGNGDVSCSSFSLVREACSCMQPICRGRQTLQPDRKSTRLNSSHLGISYAVFCLKKKKKKTKRQRERPDMRRRRRTRHDDDVT